MPRRRCCDLGGDGEPATPGGGLQAAGLRVQVQGVWRQGNRVAATAGRAHAQAHGFRHLDGGVVQRLADIGRQQHVAPEHRLHPALPPRGAALAGEAVKVRVLPQRQKHRARRALTQCRHPFTPAGGVHQRPDGAIACQGGEFGVHDAAAPPQVRQPAPQPLEHGGLRQSAQPQRLVQPGRELLGRLLDQGRARCQGRFADALQIAPAVAQVGELGHRLPGQPLLHALWQRAGGRQGAVHQQFLGPVPLPGHVRRDELGHKALAVHVQGRSRLAPQLLELLQKGVPGQRRRGQSHRWPAPWPCVPC